MQFKLFKYQGHITKNKFHFYLIITSRPLPLTHDDENIKCTLSQTEIPFRMEFSELEWGMLQLWKKKVSLEIKPNNLTHVMRTQHSSPINCLVGV